MNRNQAFGMNNSLSSNIFNGTGEFTHIYADFEVQQKDLFIYYWIRLVGSTWSAVVAQKRCP